MDSSKTESISVGGTNSFSFSTGASTATTESIIVGAADFGEPMDSCQTEDSVVTGSVKKMEVLIG